MDGPSIIGQMAWFVILTFIYTYLEYGIRVQDKPDSENKVFAYKAIYILLAVIGQYFITVSASAALCGTPQYYTALFATAFPWIFIFGVMIGMLSVFPGWVMPLANTIGYLVANSMGMGKLANEIFAKPEEGSDMDPDLVKALSFIYTDKASLLNNVTPSNFEDFWKNGEKLRVPMEDDEEKKKTKKKFKDFVLLKYAIGVGMWYLMTGVLVISVSYNAIVNASCTTNVSQISQEASTLLESQNAAQVEYPRYVSKE